MDYLTTKARDDRLVVLSLTVVSKGASRRKSKNPISNKGERSHWAYEEEAFLPPLIRDGASDQKLDFLSGYKEKYIRFSHFQLEKAMKKGSGRCQFKVGQYNIKAAQETPRVRC